MKNNVVLTNEEMKAAMVRYILSGTAMTAGYVILMFTIGFWPAVGIFFIQMGMNFDRSGDKIVSKFQ